MKKEVLTLYKMEHSASFLLMKDPMTDKIANFYSRPSFPLHNGTFHAHPYLRTRSTGKRNPSKKNNDKRRSKPDTSIVSLINKNCFHGEPVILLTKSVLKVFYMGIASPI